MKLYKNQKTKNKQRNRKTRKTRKSRKHNKIFGGVTCGAGTPGCTGECQFGYFGGTKNTYICSKCKKPCT